MADLTDKSTDEPVSVMAGGDPFDGDSTVFAWPRDVSIGQLQIEVTAQLGENVRLAVVAPVDEVGGPAPVDAQNPLTVFVTPTSADVAAVRQVFAAHRPDPYFGMGEEERHSAQLADKVRSGEDLTVEEMRQALRLLVS